MIVVDTNIVVYHVVRGPRGVAADILAKTDPVWAAPILWRSEFRNVLAGSIRRGMTSEDEARRLLDRAAGSLLGGEHIVSDAAVIALVARSSCTAYDCEFVALAQILGVLLITEDRTLLREFPGQCRSLDDAVRRGVR